GLGWSVQHIDDDVCAAVALSRLHTKQALVRYAYQNRHALEGFVANLEHAADFACQPSVQPQRLRVRARQRQPGPDSATGAALEALKAEMGNDGYYRFADMIALAQQAVE